MNNLNIWKTFDVPSFKPYRVYIDIKSKEEEHFFLDAIINAKNSENLLNREQFEFFKQLQHCIIG